MSTIPPEIKSKIIQRPDGRWQCPLCSKHYKQKYDLYGHIRNKHLQKQNQQTTMNNFVRTEKTISSNGIEILPVNEQEYYITKLPEKYVPQSAELKLLEAHMENQLPLLFVGPKGVGKTLSVAHFAYINKIPIIQFDCSENTKRFDLIGRFILIGNEVKYLLGALPTAIILANRCGRAILVLEELNALTPAQQKVLNQLLDWRRHVYIPELGKTYRLENGTKLLVVATMNPSTYGGTYELNEDLRSRFAEFRFNYPNEEIERKIVAANVDVSGIDDDIIRGILRLAKETRAGESQGELSYAMSPRDVVNCLRMYKDYLRIFKDRNMALRHALSVTVFNRYDDNIQRKSVIERAISIFGNIFEEVS